MFSEKGMSREGRVPGVLASLGLAVGWTLLIAAGRHYRDPGWVAPSMGLGGLLALGLSGAMVYQLVVRRDYPWVMFVAAIAIPLYQPHNKPDTLAWRLVGGGYGLLLVVAAVYAFVRMVQQTDELERRINHEALSFAFGVSLVLAMGYALFSDLLPPLDGLWVAAWMIVCWLVGWNVATRRYR